MQNITEKAVEEEKPSKTQRKKDMHSLQKIGEELVALNTQQLEELDLPETLSDAIVHAQKINKFGARQRQLQYIGKLMRTIEIEPIKEKLLAWSQASLHHRAQLHQIESWRKRLFTDTDAITEFVKIYPSAEIQHIRLLIRHAKKENETGQPSKSYRLLFKALQAAMYKTPTT